MTTHYTYTEHTPYSINQEQFECDSWCSMDVFSCSNDCRQTLFACLKDKYGPDDIGAFYTDEECRPAEEQCQTQCSAAEKQCEARCEAEWTALRQRLSTPVA